MKIIQGIDGIGIRRNIEKDFRNILTCLETVEGFDSDFIERFRKVLKVEKASVREIYITTEELVEAYNNIYRMLFRLIVYSGIRYELAVEMLATYGLGNYMPIEFVNELDRVEFKSGTAKEGIRHDKVSASTIRKWHLNFMIENGISKGVVDFISRRASVTVGSTYYLHKTKQADQFYAKID